jgi:Flp pilus assembly protein TadD
MKGLYDLLAASPDDDAEGLTKAFRRAVAANHPDLHPGDPHAQARLRGIVRAYAILRDTHGGTAREHGQGIGRPHHRRKSTRIFFETTVAIAVLAAGLGGGYLLLSDALMEPNAGVATRTTGASTRIANVQPALRTSTTEPEEPRREPEDVVVPSTATAPSTATVAVKSGEVAGTAKSGPTATLPGRDVEVATVIEDSGATNQHDAKPAARHHKKEGIELRGQSQNQELADAPDKVAAVQPAARTEATGAGAPREKPADVPETVVEPSAAATATNSAGVQSVVNRGPALGVPSNDAEFHRERGLAAYRSGDFHQAITDLDQAIQLNPNDAKAYNIRGNAWDEMGVFERALADYDEAIRIDPNHPAVFHDRGIMWQRQGALDKALVDLDQAIRFSFADANIYCDRGLIWYEKGRHDRAIADFNQAIKLDPNFATACINRGLILHRNSELNLAFANTNQEIRVDPSIVDAIRLTNLHH